MLCVDSNRRNNVNILHFSFAGEVLKNIITSLFPKFGV